MDREQPKRPSEENAIILEYLKHGYASASNHHKSSVAQAIGLQDFTLLELVPKKEVFLQPQQEVYLGDGKRDQIHHIKGRIPFERLTGSAESELIYAIKKIVELDETRYIFFFNNARPLSMRMHQLELLPGLGKKHMWEIIDERKGKPFENFADLKERVKLLPDPKSIIIKRILLEVKGKEKYRLFAKI